MVNGYRPRGWRWPAARALRAVIIAWRHLTGNPPTRKEKLEFELQWRLSRLEAGDLLILQGIFEAVHDGELSSDKILSAAAGCPSREEGRRRLGAILSSLPHRTA